MRTVMAGLVPTVLLLSACSGGPSSVPAPEGTGPAETGQEGWVTQATAGVVEVAQPRDGDSFVGTDGVEYRVGLVNTPELSECGGRQAADRTDELLADGFVPDPYAEDQHGRAVARVQVPDGDLGIILAAEGLADDRYLEDFRHEHPDYAAELDRAFDEARRDARGLWNTCWADSPSDLSLATPRAGTAGAPDDGGRDDGNCHPAYVECMPDGPDLDCADVGHQVRLAGDADPYRLDGNTTTRSDGVGCDTFPEWSPTATYPYQP